MPAYTALHSIPGHVLRGSSGEFHAPRKPPAVTASRRPGHRACGHGRLRDLRADCAPDRLRLRPIPARPSGPVMLMPLRLLPWPLPALLAWAGAWLLYLSLQRAVPPVAALVVASLLG